MAGDRPHLNCSGSRRATGPPDPCSCPCSRNAAPCSVRTRRPTDAPLLRLLVEHETLLLRSRCDALLFRKLLPLRLWLRFRQWLGSRQDESVCILCRRQLSEHALVADRRRAVEDGVEQQLHAVSCVCRDHIVQCLRIIPSCLVRRLGYAFTIRDCEQNEVDRGRDVSLDADSCCTISLRLQDSGCVDSCHRFLTFLGETFRYASVRSFSDTVRSLPAIQSRGM